MVWAANIRHVVKTLCNFEPHIWLEIITSHNAIGACFKGSRTSRNVIDCGVFSLVFGRKKRSHHVMDTSSRWSTLHKDKVVAALLAGNSRLQSSDMSSVTYRNPKTGLGRGGGYRRKSLHLGSASPTF